MINWRKPLIHIAFYMTGRPVSRCLISLKSAEAKSPEELTRLHNDKLARLLLHAYENVPYYNRILSQAEVVKNNTVNLDNFSRIPILTKDIIRHEGENLYSRDRSKRGWFLNSTGGSTGEPLRFLQDRHYETWMFAGRFLYNSWAGKEVGQRELLLWGSERDILLGAEKISTRIKRCGFNMAAMNSFLMTDETMKKYVEQWNKFKPEQVWAYTNSIVEFSRYIKKSGVKIFRPTSIICAAETLTEDARKTIREVFDCIILNQYGSREAGTMACECPKTEGLHVFSLHNKVEILDHALNPCGPGQAGKIYVTTLQNYSMPLIRYDIGDMATATENKHCSCGRAWPLMKNVIGRHIEVFRTQDGKIVPGEFFIHFIGVVYNKNYIKKFQVVQKDYDYIVVKLVITDQRKFDEFKPDIVNSIKKVMGQQCRVEFECVDDIPPAKSGKYLYTISEVPD